MIVIIHDRKASNIDAENTVKPEQIVFYLMSAMFIGRTVDES